MGPLKTHPVYANLCNSSKLGAHLELFLVNVRAYNTEACQLNLLKVSLIFMCKMQRKSEMVILSH